MEAQILYKDWMMLTRNVINPMASDEFIFKNETYSFTNDSEIEMLRSTWNDEKCYVEIELPIIEWKRNDSFTGVEVYQGLLHGYIQCFNIHKKDDKYILTTLGMDQQTCLIGSLDECKLEANKLFLNVD